MNNPWVATMRAKYRRQQGATVLITCVILSAGLLVTALSIQAQTSKDLYQTEGQIRIEQALQLEQAAQTMLQPFRRKELKSVI